MFPGHPESWTPLQIPSWGPPLGCTLLHPYTSGELEACDMTAPFSAFAVS